MNRREFLVGFAGAAAVATGAASASPSAGGTDNLAPDSTQPVGMLVDTTECIGCRKCEYACAKANGLTDLPLEQYEDTSVFAAPRRMEADAYTVVNRYSTEANPDKPIFVKVQCMHCLKPACASACIVGALRRQETGAVTYDAWKCLGCRYCMVACPFQVPAYEYENALTPVVSKCNFCFERVAQQGTIPACAEICPPACLTFANRAKLLELAREKIAANPTKYVNYIYGEHEVGGTSWLYLASRPVTELGLVELTDKPVPALTETIQHSIFKFGIPPLLLYALLGAAMKTFGAPETEQPSRPSAGDV